MTLPSWASAIISLASVAAALIVSGALYNRFTRVPFKPKNKHCFITGGSTGLGKGLAIELAKQGADVCIVARRVSELETAAEEIKVF